jgi:hypothetical protein
MKNLPKYMSLEIPEFGEFATSITTLYSNSTNSRLMLSANINFKKFLKLKGFITLMTKPMRFAHKISTVGATANILNDPELN